VSQFHLKVQDIFFFWDESIHKMDETAKAYHRVDEAVRDKKFILFRSYGQVLAK
jgi:hypothetical protein